jgi:hypothetical protein
MSLSGDGGRPPLTRLVQQSLEYLLLWNLATDQNFWSNKP